MKPIVRSHLIATILSAIFLLVTVAGLFIFIRTIREREQRVLDARDRLASYEQNKRKLSDESAELTAIKARVIDLEKNVITEDTAPTLLSSIEALAKKNGINFALTSVTATTATAASPSRLHIDFSADGSFAGLQQFVSDTLSQPYEAQLTRLSLYLTDNGNAKSSGSWQLLAGIDIISY